MNSVIKKIATTAYPDYKGRKFFAKIQERPIDTRSYWDGGSRDYFVFVDLRNGRTMGVPAQSAYDKPMANADAIILPEHCACVRRKIFCGKEMGLTVIFPSQAVLNSCEQSLLAA